MDRRQALAYLAGLAAFEVLQLQPAQTTSGTHVQHTALPSTDYVSVARHCAIENGLDPECFLKQINQESGFHPAAVSSVGAIGIAQFMPETAAGLGINPHDPVQSLEAAARLMAHYVTHYRSYALALAAYNAGPGAVSYALEHGGADWYSWLPLETQHYIAAILW